MSEHQVIIIGAGISGLAAAYKMTNKGFNDFLIIEATGRVGGRINTMEFQSSFIEIGAQWIHGTENNPVYELASSIDVVDEKEYKAEKMYYSTQDGKELDERLVESIEGETEKIMDGFEDLISSEYEGDERKSIGELLDEAYPSLEKEFSSEADRELIKGIFRAQFNNERFESSCDDLHNLSATGWNNYETLGGNQFCNFKYGYSKVTEYLHSQLPEDNVKLNQVVEKIDWSGDMIKIVAYDNREKKRKTYTCAKVLCTIPLGCLKRNHDQLFTPKLPANKVDAISRLGFGCVNKIFVVFDGDFEPDFNGLQIIWRDDLNFELEYSKKKWNLKNNKFIRAFDNFDKLPNHRNVLLGFTAGENAEFIETLEDECVLDVIRELIERCFPYAELPKPVKIIRSRWASNAYSRGSYSYIKVGSTIEDMNALADPVDDRLFFSGEATIYANYGTVHGAYISGNEAANQILMSLENSE